MRREGENYRERGRVWRSKEREMLMGNWEEYIERIWRKRKRKAI